MPESNVWLEQLSVSEPDDSDANIWLKQLESVLQEPDDIPTLPPQQDLPVIPVPSSEITAPLDYIPQSNDIKAEQEKQRKLKTNTDYLKIPSISAFADQYYERLHEVFNAPSKNVEQTKELFANGNWFLGALNAINYPFTPIDEAIHQFVGEPTERLTGIPATVTDIAAGISVPIIVAKRFLPKIPSQLNLGPIKQGYFVFRGQASHKPLEPKGLGMHFSEDPEIADIFAQRYNPDASDSFGYKGIGEVKRVILNIKNPLRIIDSDVHHENFLNIAEDFKNQNLIPENKAYEWIDAFEEELVSKNRPQSKDFTSAQKFYEAKSTYLHSLNLKYAAKIKKYFQSQGYDGIVYKNQGEGGGDSYIAFEKEQITDRADKAAVARLPNLPTTPNVNLNLLMNRKNNRHRGGFRQFTKDMADIWYKQSASYLDDLAKVSPTANSIRNMIQNPIAARIAVGPDFTEGVRIARGNFISKLNDAIDNSPLKKKLISGRISETDNEAIKDVLISGNPGSRKEINDVALKIRLLLTEAKDYLKKSKIEIEEIKNYFPRQYDINKNNQNAFIKLARDKGMPDKRIERMLSDIQGQNGFPLTSRELDFFSDAELKPFTKNNVVEVLQNYFETITSQAEFNKRFSNLVSEQSKQKIFNKIKDEAFSAGYKVDDSELQRIDNILLAFKHKYHRLDNQTFKKLTPMALGYEYMRLLNRAVLSNLPEIFLNLYYTKPQYVFKLIPDAVSTIGRQTARIINKSIDKSDVTKEFERMHGALNTASAEVVREMFGLNPSKIVDASFKITGLTSLTNFNKIMSHAHGKLFIEDRIQRIISNTIKFYDAPAGSNTKKLETLIRRDSDDLIELGIDADKIRKDAEILRSIKNSGVDVNQLFSGYLQSKEQIIGQGALRFTDRVIFHPSASNRPLRFSGDVGKIMGQLQSFNTMFANTVFPKLRADILGKMKGDPPLAIANALRAATTAAFMTGIGHLSVQWKYWSRNDEAQIKKRDREISRNPEKALFDAFNQSGWLGAFTPLSNMWLTNKYGGNWLDTAFGPTVTQIGELGEAAMNAGIKGSPKPLIEPTLKAFPELSTNKAARDPLEKALERFLR